MKVMDGEELMLNKKVMDGEEMMKSKQKIIIIWIGAIIPIQIIIQIQDP